MLVQELLLLILRLGLRATAADGGWSSELHQLHVLQSLVQHGLFKALQSALAALLEESYGGLHRSPACAACMANDILQVRPSCREELLLYHSSSSVTAAALSAACSCRATGGIR